MRGVIHRAQVPLLATLLLGVAASCSTTVEVAFDPREDFSRYRTWNFLPGSPPRVDAPHGNARALDGRLARLVARGLAEIGLERRATAPDVLVSYHLVLRRQVVEVEEPRAPYLLSSHHSSASYWVEGSNRVRHVHEEVRLGIGLVETSGRMVWRAAWLRTLEEAPILPLDEAVASLLERYPRPGASDPAGATAAGPAPGSSRARAGRELESAPP
jgi:hypothetical protein